MEERAGTGEMGERKGREMEEKGRDGGGEPTEERGGGGRGVRVERDKGGGGKKRMTLPWSAQGRQLYIRSHGKVLTRRFHSSMHERF